MPEAVTPATNIGEGLMMHGDAFLSPFVYGHTRITASPHLSNGEQILRQFRPPTCGLFGWEITKKSALCPSEGEPLGRQCSRVTVEPGRTNLQPIKTYASLRIRLSEMPTQVCRSAVHRRAR